MAVRAGTALAIAAIATHPSDHQRRVFILRDVEGYTSAEVCSMLELSEVNQHVLLHRARSRIRAVLEEELGCAREACLLASPTARDGLPAVGRTVTEYLEGTLPPALQDAANRHLADCPHCREYLEQMRRTVTVGAGLRDDAVPPDIVEALTRAFADYRSGAP